MQYAHDPRTFLFSHYVYRGLRSATGVIGATLIAMHFGDLPTAMVVSMGALCTSLMDLPSPIHHKFNEMLASVLLCTLVTLVVSLASPFPRVLPLVVVAVTFLSAMMTVYGNKTMPLQFSTLFVMTLTLSEDFVVRRAFEHALLFCAGASAYMTYALAVSWLLQRRTRQQILAESLYELAGYLEIKAGFYDAGNDYEEQFNALVRQQIVVAERQQAARDLVLRGNRTPHDGLLVQVHLRMLDLYEYILSTNTDYPLLRQTFGGTPVLDDLRRLVRLMCQDVETIAYDVTRGRPSYSETDYREALRAASDHIAMLRHHHVDPAAMTALSETLDMVRGAIALVEQLHVASRTPVEPRSVLPGPDMKPFLTRQRYEWRAMRDNLRWRSPAFRFALRVTLAVSVGLWVANQLPYASHSYWILLTIVVILKPNFSMTKQRYNDRLIGTLIGCLIALGILRFVQEPLVLLAVLFVSLVASATFITIKYRYTAIAACVQVLVQINLLAPGSPPIVGERLIDTVIGGVIASIFSFVLPSWEYRSIPNLVENVLKANRRYIAATRDLLLLRTEDDFAYRVERKQFMDSLSALIGSFQRMLDEPRSRHRAVDNLNRFIVQNYLVAAHVAAARVQVRQHYEDLDMEAARAAIDESTSAAMHSLLLASDRLRAGERAESRGAGFIRQRRAAEQGESEKRQAGVAPGAGDVGAAGSEQAAQQPASVSSAGAVLTIELDAADTPSAKPSADASAGLAAASVADSVADPAAERAAELDDRRVRMADTADRWHTETMAHRAAEPDARPGVTERGANAVLSRRLRALRTDAAKIALRTGAIGRAIRDPR